MSGTVNIVETIFGIDFGTTNSACVGIVNRKQPIKYTDGFDNPFPSVVAIDKLTGEVFCGRDAWKRRNELSESCLIIPSIKSYLGTEKRWEIPGMTWTPEMVAAQVFAGLKRQVEERSAGYVDFDNVIVAVPAGFAPEKRASLRKAALIAGIEIKSFVSEPTAAVFHCYGKVRPYSKLAVFDWGGGTLDIAVLENTGGIIREIAVSGIRLGGDDIDLKLAQWAHGHVVGKTGKEIAFEDMSAEARDLMIVKCEQAKRELSDTGSVSIRINKYGEFGAVKVHLDIDTFTSLIRYELERAFFLMKETLHKAKVSIDELGCVLMVGGSTNIAPLAEVAQNTWPCPVVFAEESDWSVAFGAASLNLEGGDYYASEAIGIELSDRSFYPLVTQDSRLFDANVNAAFAIVEEAESAVIKFVDLQGNTLGYLSIPVFGFLAEVIKLGSKINNDLVLEVWAVSDKKGLSGKRTWLHPGIAQYYKLPELVRRIADEHETDAV